TSIRRDVERARNIASSENHGLVAEGDTPSAPLTSISVPTLVIHGTADPMFPLEHGQALVNEILGARLLPLEGSGHGVERADWETIARAAVLARARNLASTGARTSGATSCDCPASVWRSACGSVAASCVSALCW